MLKRSGGLPSSFWRSSRPPSPGSSPRRSRFRRPPFPTTSPTRPNGERIFYAGGCASCHAAPEAKGEDKLKLAGGLELNTPFGLFRVPNISPDPETGIGGWSTLDFVNAVMRGVSPGGAHFYPAFPYASYARMRIEDVIDLKAFMDTLPPVSNRVAGHELGFPFNIRRGVGLWKRLYLSDAPVLALADASEAVRRGQYLVEGPGHCGECHTSRDFDGRAEEGAVARRRAESRGQGRHPQHHAARGGHRQLVGGRYRRGVQDRLQAGFRHARRPHGAPCRQSSRIFPTRTCRRSPPTSRPSRRCPTRCRARRAATE